MGIWLVVIVVGVTVSGQKSEKLSQSQTPLGRGASFPCPPFLLMPLTAECQLEIGWCLRYVGQNRFVLQRPNARPWLKWRFVFRGKCWHQLPGVVQAPGVVLDPGWPCLLCSCPQYDRRLATGSIQKDKRRGRTPSKFYKWFWDQMSSCQEYLSLFYGLEGFLVHGGPLWLPLFESFPESQVQWDGSYFWILFWQVRTSDDSPAHGSWKD